MKKKLRKILMIFLRNKLTLKELLGPQHLKFHNRNDTNSTTFIRLFRPSYRAPNNGPNYSIMKEKAVIVIFIKNRKNSP